MSSPPFIPRVLSFVADGSEERLNHRQLLDLSSNLIVLGGAGIGKTRLLEELAGERALYVTAQRLINAPAPHELVEGYECLLVDALDEAPAHKAGEAVNDVLSQIERSRVPRFILSCRTEEWQAATASSLIAQTFGQNPLELTLVSFEDEQILSFLTERLGAGEAIGTVEHYEQRGLGDWLGNPQTLMMLATLVEQGREPDSTSELFEGYVDLSLPEANRSRRSQQDDVGLEGRKDILGAAFAALILSGKAALARPGADLSEEDLALSDLKALPGDIDWSRVSGNRLIRQYRNDNERFIYSHRRIGEWLAARWLAKQARNEDVRERLMAALVTNRVVPASLRGLFGWLANYSEFADQVLTIDPMAVIEYADADILSQKQAQMLLRSLEDVAEADPYFIGWSRSHARALVTGEILPSTLGIISDKERNARLRILLAQQFKGEPLRDDTLATLKCIAMDSAEFYAIREVVAEAVVQQLGTADVRAMVEELRRQGSHDSTRLGAQILLEAGVDQFDDEQIVQTVMAYCGHTICAVPNEGEDRLAAKTWRFRREIPDDRVEGVLDLLSQYAESLLPEYRSIESSDIINLGDALIARRLRQVSVDPAKLLLWLKAFSGRDGYDQDVSQDIFGYLRDNSHTRQAIQRLWFSDVDTQQDFFLAAHRLHEVHQALSFSDSDLAAFLDGLPDDYPYWQEASRLIRHDVEHGELTRDAVRRFLSSDRERDAYVEGLLNPTKPEWQIRNEERIAERETERETRWAEFRDGMKKDKALLKVGRFGLMQQAANVYLARYSDLRDTSLDERMNALCGADVVPSVREGFEVFLNRMPPYPHAQEIADSYANSRAWNARYILLAGLAERLRNTGTIEPVDQDHLVSAQLHVAHQSLYGDEWNDLREAIWRTLTSNELAFERYARLLVEPSLKEGREIIMGLYELLHEGRTAYPSLVDALVLEWLERFPDAHHRPETELIDVLLGGVNCPALSAISAQRLAQTDLSDEKRRNWLAVSLICDFENAYPTIEAKALTEPELFWAIRERAGARRPYDDNPEKFTTELAAWLVTHFRNVFPHVPRPDGVTSGDTNPWDATEVISRLIDKIGTDPTPQAESLLKTLAETHDGYRERALAVLAEHRRISAERERATLSAAELAAILTSQVPQNIVDLRVRMVQLLGRVEAQARSSPTDSWMVFYRDDGRTPHGEERCRDRIIELLQQHEHEIAFSPEKHLGEDREGDIACEIGDLHLPIEVKGQWHSELWRAADSQLAAQQACDHKARGNGILLVLWFGDQGKSLAGPPRDSGIAKPTSPEDLEKALTGYSDAARQGAIVVKVIDLSRV